MFPYYPQQTYPYAQMRQSLNGRLVTNIEEARAAQIDLDGSQWYFPCPSEKKIYVKYINIEGTPSFLEYRVAEERENSLVKRVENLEIAVKELKSYEPVRTNGNDENVQ